MKVLLVAALSFCVMSQVFASSYGKSKSNVGNNQLLGEVVESGGEVDPNAEVGAASIKSNSNIIRREVVELGGDVDPNAEEKRKKITDLKRQGVDLAGATFAVQNPQGLSDAALLEKIKLGSFDSLDFSSSENPIATSEDGLEPAEVQRRKTNSNVGTN